MAVTEPVPEPEPEAVEEAVEEVVEEEAPPTDEEVADALEDHAGALTQGEWRSAQLLREAAARLRAK